MNTKQPSDPNEKHSSPAGVDEAQRTRESHIIRRMLPGVIEPHVVISFREFGEARGNLLITDYAVLNLKDFTQSIDQINAAADQRTAHIQSLLPLNNPKLCQEFLGVVNRAKQNLLDTGRRSAYDARLHAVLQQRQPAVQAPLALDFPAPSEEPAAVVDPFAFPVASEFQPSTVRYNKPKNQTGLIVVGVVAAVVVVVGIVFLSLGGGGADPQIAGDARVNVVAEPGARPTRPLVDAARQKPNQLPKTTDLWNPEQSDPELAAPQPQSTDGVEQEEARTPKNNNPPAEVPAPSKSATTERADPIPPADKLDEAAMRARAEALLVKGGTAAAFGRYDEARAHLTEARTVYEKLNDFLGRNMANSMMSGFPSAEAGTANPTPTPSLGEPPTVPAPVPMVELGSNAVPLPTSPDKFAEVPPPFSGKDAEPDSPIPDEIQQKLSHNDTVELVQLLMYPHPEVRKNAASGLSYYDGEIPLAVFGLRMALRDPNKYVRSEAASSLNRLGKAARPAIPDLVEALKDPYWYVVSEAAEALEKFGPDAAAAVPNLIAALPRLVDTQRTPLLVTLAAIGPEAKPAIPHLRPLIGPGTGHIGITLGALGAESEILSLLKSADRLEVQEGAEGAGYLPKHSPELIKLLFLACQDRSPFPNHMKRTKALLSLGLVRPTTPAIVSAMARLSKDEESRVREALMTGLGNTDPLLPSAVALLKAGTQDKDKMVRDVAAKALSKRQEPAGEQQK